MTFLSRLRAKTVLRKAAEVLVAGLITGLVVYAVGRWTMGTPPGLEGMLSSVVIGVIYAAVMGGGLDATGWLIGRYVPIRSRWDVVIHVAARSLATLLTFVLATFTARWLFGPRFRIEPDVLLIIGLVAFSAALVGSSITYARIFYRKVREAEKAALEAELRALRAQINPHFLFNSLNSIAALIRTRPREAEAVTENLADLFRYSLRASTRPTVTIEDEIESVRLYLEIERVRFGDRLQVHVDVPEALRRARVPSLVLQPLVENAVKHGVSRVLEPCTVTVTARREGDRVHLSVHDTGPGFDETDREKVLARGTGLANVRERLRLVFGASAELYILSSGVALRFPLQQAPEPTALQDERSLGTPIRTQR